MSATRRARTERAVQCHHDFAAALARRLGWVTVCDARAVFASAPDSR